MGFAPPDVVMPTEEEMHDLEVAEAIGERDARIERLKSLLETTEAERDGYRAAAADLRDELAQANSARAYLADDLSAERSTRLYLARNIKTLAERARTVISGATREEQLLAASLLAVEVTQLAKSSGSLCSESAGEEVAT